MFVNVTVYEIEMQGPPHPVAYYTGALHRQCVIFGKQQRQYLTAWFQAGGADQVRVWWV